MATFEHSIKLGNNVKIILLIAVILTFFTQNTVLTIVSILFIPLAVKLLWKQNEPPILFAAVMLQWLQVTIKVFLADFAGMDYKVFFSAPQEIIATFSLSIIALLVLSYGIYFSLRGFNTDFKLKIDAFKNKYNHKSIIFIYIIFIIVAPILSFIAFRSGAAVQQFILKIATFKWAILYLFYIISFSQNKGKKTFILIILIELILSFTGFFSAFKDYFLVLLICYLSRDLHLKVYQYFLIGITVLVMLVTLVLWQVTKEDYRNYVSGGGGIQMVTVDNRDALSKLQDLFTNVDADKFNAGIYQTIGRISYIDLFAEAKTQVPQRMPYERGKLWGTAVSNIFMPRFLFPNKEVIDDSQLTTKYTGILFADAAKGASVSLGYIPETYIDFGPILMFIPIFLFGYVIGFIYRYIITSSVNIIWGYALTIPLFFQIFAFETSLPKMIGGLIAYFLVYLIVRKYLIKTIDKYILKQL